MSGRLVSVSHLTALDLSPEDFVRAAAKAGFDAVGLRINPPKHTPDRWPIAGDLRRAEAIARLADDSGIGVFEAETFSVWPDFDVAAMRPGLESAAAMHVQMLVCAGIDENEPRLVENYATLADEAARFGLVVGIEFMPFRPLAALDDAVRVQRAVGRPNARILIDALHLSRCGSDAAAVAALDPATLGYIHLCDAPALPPEPVNHAEEARASRLFPGEGGLDLAGLLAAVPADLPVSLEAPNPRYADIAPAEMLAIAARKTIGLVRAADAARTAPHRERRAST